MSSQQKIHLKEATEASRGHIIFETQTIYPIYAPTFDVDLLKHLKRLREKIQKLEANSSNGWNEWEGWI